MTGAGGRAGRIVAAVLMLTTAACSSSTKHVRERVSSTVAAAPTTTVPDVPVTPTCARNAATEAITGALASASAIGWAGNGQGVVTCLGGTFYVQGSTNRAYGFGIYGGGPTTWVDADGYLPEQITTFRHGGANVSITEFADDVNIGGNAYVVVYSRVVASNAGAQTIVADPKPTNGLVP